MKAHHLLVMDVDSTITRTEGIDLLAALAGSGARVAAITEAAMRGEIDFVQSLRQRVATLQGLPLGSIEAANRQVVLSAGAAELVDCLHRDGWAVGAVSGGFEPMVEPLARQLGLDFYRANRLEVTDAALSGRIVGPVIDRAAKASALQDWAQILGLTLDRTAAMGDGANDLDMLACAGVALAYGGNPAVVAAADYAIDGSLMAALPILRQFAANS